jgi:hypothetical protein
MIFTRLHSNRPLVQMIALLITMTSCGFPKQTLQRISQSPKTMVELPPDYCNLLPTPTFEQWDNDYNYFNKFLTENVTKTQVGLSATDKGGVHIWWCAPSALTHVQLDTATMINDSKLVIGEWRIACNRTILYEDSCSYIDRKIYRGSKIVTDDKEDDVYLNVSADKFDLFSRSKNKSSFRSIAHRNYQIENKRYLMLYKYAKASAAISFIGLDKENRLIVNSFSVQERKLKSTYIVYKATMSQMIFSRL